MEDEIKTIRDDLDKAVEQNNTDDIVGYLKAIALLDISKELLKKTLIGKSVGLLRTHKNAMVAKESAALVDKWKDQLQIPKKSSEPASPVVTTEYKKKSTSSSSSSSSSSSTTTTPDKSSTPKRKSYHDEDDNTENDSREKQNNGNVKKQVVHSIVNSTLPQMSDSTRATTLKLIAEGLTTDEQTELHYNQAAVAIEKQLYEMFGGVTSEYRVKVRSIIFNLKSNTVLKKNILNNTLTATRFCNMDATEMANKELKEERERMLKYSREAATLSRDAATTDQFQCGKCKQRKCTYFQLQTRSADEPLTTFVTCVNCNNRWKFC